MPIEEDRFVVAQLGARMHYAVPRLLDSHGYLEMLFTDVYAQDYLKKFVKLLPDSMQPPALRRWLGRHSNGIGVEKIRHFPVFGLEYLIRRKMITRDKDALKTWLWVGKKFCEKVISKGGVKGSHLYTYNSAGLELMTRAKGKGLVCIMEQTIAPKAVECALLKEAGQRHPGWAVDVSETDMYQAFVEREEAEWRLADLILCGSDFVIDGIGRRGGPVEKCRLVPYGVQAPNILGPNPAHSGPLRVLFAGSVGLRKGVPAVVETAKRLGKRAQVRLVGPLEIPKLLLDEISKWVDVIGAVPRAEMEGHFKWADVFFLPSWCEGSATVTYEALVRGLPVLCTPNTGSMVRSGLDGWLVPPEDVEAMVGRLSMLAESPELLATMKNYAFEGRRRATLDAYGERILAALRLDNVNQGASAQELPS